MDSTSGCSMWYGGWQLLYGEKAAIAFTNNRRGGGARVELFLPIVPVLQKKEGETA